MATRVFKKAYWTLEAVADTTNMADGKYLAIQGGSSTQRIVIKTIRISGLEPSVSAPVVLLLSRDSTVGATLTALSTGESDAALDPSTTDLASVTKPFTAATTKPKRSDTLGLAQLGFNALGGMYREHFPPGEEPVILGNTASFGEASLSGFTGSALALVGGYITYEVK